MDNVAGWVVWIGFLIKALGEMYSILTVGIIESIVWISIINYTELKLLNIEFTYKV